MDQEISAGVARLSITEHSDGKEEENGNGNSLKVKYNQLVLDAKEKARQGQLEESLELFLQAYKIHKSSKLEKRIEKLKEFIKEYTQEDDEEQEQQDEEAEGESEDDDGLVDIGNGYRIAKEIKESLYQYQIDALLWFWKLFKRKQGGILGDDMGLGKTVQVIAFLSGMFDNEHIKSALIVVPVAVIENWEKEFKRWTPGIRVKCFYGNSKKERLKNLQKVQQKNGVCLTSYGMVVSNFATLSENINGQPYKWDYIILDEGHKIKNPTKTSKVIRAIPARHHFILTGTPIQNNLKEMWALFDFVCQGQLLGSAKTFKTEFETPIVRARERDASAYEMKVGNEMAKSLRKIINPYFLRRTKAEVLKEKKTDPADAVDGEQMILTKTPGKASVPKMLTRKNDLIVWLHLSDAQLKIYMDFLKLDEIKELLMSTRSPLAELNVLKKICDHPRLLSAMACSKLGLTQNDRQIDLDGESNNDLKQQFSESIAGVSDKALIQESGKLVFLVKLLDNLKDEGHRCLVFTQSRKMLDMIQRVITHRGHKVLRIDGTIRSTAEREHLITTFQNNPSYTCFLLTTQVGGVGLTLTGADRVVIFDPSWNPATDAQAVDRAYRIGQTKSVVIYRLITCGSIEEKIYRKQVFKNALSQQATGASKNPFRYFTSQDLRELFTLDDPRKSKTQMQLNKMHALHRKTDAILDKHIDFLHTLGIFGLSDHDLIYSQEAIESVDDADHAATHDAIQARVLRAQHMVAAESNNSGLPLQSTLPAPYENPKSILKPINLDNIPDDGVMKKKIQARLHEFEVFKPTRDDKTSRFMTHKINKPFKNPMPPATSEVIDLSSPATDIQSTSRISPGMANGKTDQQPTVNQVKKEKDVTVIPDDDDNGIETSMANMSIAEEKETMSSADYEIDDSSGSDSIQDQPVGNSTRLSSNNEDIIETSDNQMESVFEEPLFDVSDTSSVQKVRSFDGSCVQNNTPLGADSQEVTALNVFVPEVNSVGSHDLKALPIDGSNIQDPAIERLCKDAKTSTPQDDLGSSLPDYHSDQSALNGSVNEDGLNPINGSSQEYNLKQPLSKSREDTEYGTPQILDSITSSILSINQDESPSEKISDEKSNLSDSDVFIKSRDSLQNSSDFPNFQVEMSPNDMSKQGDEAYLVNKIQNNIINNILVESPVVDISNRQQTPRRKSSSKSRRKSVSQQLFNNSDSEDSDDEIGRNTKTPRRVRRIESDDEDDDVHFNAASVKSLENSFCSVNDDGNDNEASYIEADNGHNDDNENGDDDDDNGDYDEGNDASYIGADNRHNCGDDNGKDDDGNGDYDEDNDAIQKRRARRLLSDDEEVESSASSSDDRSDKLENTMPEEEQDNAANLSHGIDDSQHTKGHRQRVKGLDSESEEEASSATSPSSKGESDEDDNAAVRKSRVRGLDSTDEDSEASSPSDTASSSDRDSFESEDKDQSRQGRFSCPNGIHGSDAVKVQRCECVLDQEEKSKYDHLVQLARHEEDKFSALKHLLDALKMNSGDPHVQKEALLLIKELGLGPE